MHLSVVTAAILSILVIAAAPSAAAITYYVDNQSLNCSRNGAGTESEPYCTIGDAVAARGGPGVEIVVKPGVYREQVTMVSGSEGAQFVVRAQGPGVVVSGADDLSGASRWTPVSGTVYVTGDVSWSPLQVFVDGVRLVRAPAGTEPADVGVGSFLYAPGQGLYVNLDGPNPGTRAIEVGRRTYGFRLSNKSYVTIDGFHVTRTEDKGIYLNKGSANSVIRGCLVDFTHTQGIAISEGSGVLVESNVVTDSQDHGIYLSSGTTGCTIQGNESTRHAFPNVRAFKEMVEAMKGGWGLVETWPPSVGYPGNALFYNRSIFPSDPLA